MYFQHPCLGDFNTIYMKMICFIIVFCASLVASAQTSISIADPAKKIKVVETSCGECQFKMEGKGCHLAVRIKGKSYFVEGTTIDEHGDAHAADGFCEAIKKAEVQGKVVNNRFNVTYFKIVRPTAEAANGLKLQ